VKKANYGRAGGHRVLRYRDGTFVLDGSAQTDKLKSDAEADRIFLDCLADFTRSGREVSSKKSNVFAPALFGDSPLAQGLKSDALTKAMERLFAASSHPSRNRWAALKATPTDRRRASIAGP